MSEDKEVKVLYQDGENGAERVIRGILESEDDTFIVIKRRDGHLRINKKYVVKIEGWD